LDRCLGSLSDQADEIILVDNGSTGEAVRAAGRTRGVRVVRLEENRGFAGGVNAGVAASSGDVVALLNDDAVARPSWLATSARLLEDDTVAAVGPKILLARHYLEVVLDEDEHFAPGDSRPLGRRLISATLDGQDVLSALLGAGVHRLEVGQDGEVWRWTAGRRPFYVPIPGELKLAAPPSDGTGVRDATLSCPVQPSGLELVLNGKAVPTSREVELVNSAGSYLRRDGYAGDCGADTPDDGQWDEPRECFAVTGTALVTTASVLARVGPLWESYFAYYEDTDWCWRARLGGYNVVYDPSSVVRHVRGQTSGGTLAARTRFLAERNRILTLAHCAPLRVATGEARRKWLGGGDDGVARVLAHQFPVALSERARLRRSWTTTSRHVYERWAGVDVR
jgi:GT2 family glycosyltransferase